MSRSRLEIQIATFKLLREYGHPHPGKISLENLAMDRKAVVVEGSMEGVEGRLLTKGDSGIIRVSDSIQSPGRRRFTIAHELGHWELHRGKKQFLCTKQDLVDYSNSPLEVEANIFASLLLMPASHFRGQCRDSDDPSLTKISGLAEEFRTSLTATAVRYAEESKKPIVIVLSENGTVRWSYSDKKKNLPFVVAGKMVPQDSSAGLSEYSEEVEHFEEADWFSELTYKPREVMEQSVSLGRYPYILTLLWLPE